jgi:hypothetical protein
MDADNSFRTADQVRVSLDLDAANLPVRRQENEQWTGRQDLAAGRIVGERSDLETASQLSPQSC